MIRLAAACLLVGLLSACDASGPSRYDLEVETDGPVALEDGRPGLRFTVRNTGRAGLESVSLEVTTPPVLNRTTGVQIYNLVPGEDRVADIDLFHLFRDEWDYDCYRVRVVAFAPDGPYAVLEQNGPDTCD
ncbi:hypothetical protein [Rubrivirga sp.]|uniref:hypothetical protein n=1 Tax=Rubrivirga sp. TaxID=1885344 RepID=UPI003C73FD81